MLSTASTGRPARHVIFDLDSTLCDSLKEIAATRSRLLDRLFSLTPPQRHRKLRREFAKIVSADLHETEILPKLRMLLVPCQNSRSDLKCLQREFTQDAAKSARLLNGGSQLLLELKQRGISVVIWSNKRVSFVSDHIKNLRLPGLIDKVYCQAQGGTPHSDEELDSRLVVLPPIYKKPCPSFLCTILKDNHFEAEATLFVGNNIRKDGGSTIGTSVRFVHAAFNLPSTDTRKVLDKLTGGLYSGARVEAASVGVRAPVDRVITTSLMELLPMFDR
jgi:phosphoglycolate phosphatase-like HAD superfamily hydrolase